MKKWKNILFILSLIACVFSAGTAFSADHVNPSIDKDSQGFTYNVWLDYREGGATGQNGASGQIYMQKHDSMGNPQWNQDVRVNVADMYYLYNWEPTPRIAIDNNDNIYIVFCNGYALYVQKFDTSGTRIWAADKKVNVSETPEYLGFDIDCDSNGNIYVAFQRYGPAQHYTFLQKLDANGTPQWASDVYAGMGSAPQTRPKVEIGLDNSIYVSHTSTTLGGVPIRKFDAAGTGLNSL